MRGARRRQGREGFRSLCSVRGRWNRAPNRPRQRPGLLPHPRCRPHGSRPSSHPGRRLRTSRSRSRRLPGPCGRPRCLPVGCCTPRYSADLCCLLLVINCLNSGSSIRCDGCTYPEGGWWHQEPGVPAGTAHRCTHGQAARSPLSSEKGGLLRLPSGSPQARGRQGQGTAPQGTRRWAGSVGRGRAEGSGQGQRAGRDPEEQQGRAPVRSGPQWAQGLRNLQHPLAWSWRVA